MKKLLCTLGLGLLAPVLALAATNYVTVPAQFRNDAGPLKMSTAAVADLMTGGGVNPSVVAALGVSTAAIAQNLASEIANRIAADYAIGVDTQALADSLAIEIADRISADELIAADTTTLGIAIIALDSAKVNRAGDTMTGNLLIPSNYLQASSAKLGVGAVPGGTPYTLDLYSGSMAGIAIRKPLLSGAIGIVYSNLSCCFLRYGCFA